MRNRDKRREVSFIGSALQKCPRRELDAGTARPLQQQRLKLHAAEGC